jgi:hypothetical protein
MYDRTSYLEGAEVSSEASFRKTPFSLESILVKYCRMGRINHGLWASNFAADGPFSPCLG